MSMEDLILRKHSLKILHKCKHCPRRYGRKSGCFFLNTV